MGLPYSAPRRRIGDCSRQRPRSTSRHQRRSKAAARGTRCGPLYKEEHPPRKVNIARIVAAGVVNLAAAFDRQTPGKESSPEFSPGSQQPPFVFRSVFLFFLRVTSPLNRISKFIRVSKSHLFTSNTVLHRYRRGLMTLQLKTQKPKAMWRRRRELVALARREVVHIDSAN